MTNDVSIWESQLERMKAQEDAYAAARDDDFMEWLFEVSEHCNHITRREAWEEFESWENERDKKKKK